MRQPAEGAAASVNELSPGKGVTARHGDGAELMTAADGTLSVAKGVVMVSSGEQGLGRPTVKLHVGNDAEKLQSSLRGTVNVAYLPGKYIKYTVIEGEARIEFSSWKGGEFVDLTAGQMLIINPAEINQPVPVEIDLTELARTSQLLAGGLLSSKRIQTAAAKQRREISSGRLSRSAISIRGGGSIGSGSGVPSYQGSNASPLVVGAECGMERQRAVPGGLITSPQGFQPLVRIMRPPVTGGGGGNPAVLPPPPDPCLDVSGPPPPQCLIHKGPPVKGPPVKGQN